ncbi:MAG: Gfo/Idh/MocA family oxidoreductase, partial [Clostridia bacterium]|nr:Gfo/Idh/MocA family oxidoreductase [Clostridia bacterium]
MINGKFGFAVIGFGGMGNWHVNKNRNEMKDYAELVGIYDINPEKGKEAEKKGIHSFASREELLSDSRIDLVTVATPNDYHKEIVIDALRHGKNVISEKPVTMSTA